MTTRKDLEESQRETQTLAERERQRKEESRGQEQIRLLQQQVDLLKQRVDLSEQRIDEARKSNRIAWWALGVSVFAALIALGLLLLRVYEALVGS